LTTADIGEDQALVESNLLNWFMLANRWDAVMLIDEADIYLERRSLADTKRGMLVAGAYLKFLHHEPSTDFLTAFLRAMEYCKGILFLTTNRVGSFDDAFMARIHVIQYYPELNEAARRQIWVQFFDKLERERGHTMRISDSAKSYVLEDRATLELKWNGREIRNGMSIPPLLMTRYFSVSFGELFSLRYFLAFQTAVAMADYRHRQSQNHSDDADCGAVLVREDFEIVVESAHKFKNYQTALHRGDESTRALRMYERLDNFSGGTRD
jgi:hypothetical protein